MVSTTQIKPAPILQPFVHCYSLRVFNTGNQVMPQPIHAVHEYYMSFLLKEKFCYLTDNSGKMNHKKASSLITLLTEPLGCMYYKGDYVLFSIQFKSNGFFAIFGIPQKILLNTIVPIEDILGNDAPLIQEQLESSKDIGEMSGYMNAYLQKKLLSHKHNLYTTIIAGISHTISNNKGIVSIGRLAYDANMSRRNFERRFIENVGISPKLYLRITRFFNALENKMLNPQKNWTAISHEGGYFDQAHFIKECREFSLKAPEELFRYTPPPTENFIDKV
ncbi:MAG: helix-turn-helix domain-containing protein [Chitinophagaceae bacterium]